MATVIRLSQLITLSSRSQPYNTTIFGGSEDDVLIGGDADDQVFGESGNDRMVWNPGDDTDLNEGGAGTDTVEVNGGNGAEVFTTTANGTRVRFDRLDPAQAVGLGLRAVFPQVDRAVLRFDSAIRTGAPASFAFGPATRRLDGFGTARYTRSDHASRSIP